MNKRIAKADLKRSGGSSTHDLGAWPTTGECPACKTVNDKWDRDAILGHLKEEYWYVM